MWRLGAAACTNADLVLKQLILKCYTSLCLLSSLYTFIISDPRVSFGIREKHHLDTVVMSTSVKSFTPHVCLKLTRNVNLAW